MKKTFAFLLTLTLMFTNGIAVLAEEVEVPPADQISPNPNYASYTWIAPINAGGQADVNIIGQDGLSIVMVQANIGKNGSSVTASATTETNIYSDLGGTIYIQRWKNNKWNNYYSHGFLEFYECIASSSITVSVEPGYYYRVQVAHTADTLYSTAYAYSTTASIYVN